MESKQKDGDKEDKKAVGTQTCMRKQTLLRKESLVNIAW